MLANIGFAGGCLSFASWVGDGNVGEATALWLLLSVLSAPLLYGVAWAKYRGSFRVGACATAAVGVWYVGAVFYVLTHFTTGGLGGPNYTRAEESLMRAAIIIFSTTATALCSWGMALPDGSSAAQ